MGSVRSRHRQQKKHRHRPGNVTDLHHLEAGLDPSTAKASSSSATSLTLRRRTYRIGGLVAATTAAKAVAFLVAAFYFFGGALLFCVVSLGCSLLLLELATGGTPFTNPRHKMWTLAQFETFGALRLDVYVRYLVTKLALVWHSIAAIHKSAVNYSFTVSIAETPSLVELENLLDGHLPLLTYEGVTTEDEWIRSRGTSLASSICDEETSVHTSETDSLVEEVYYSIDVKGIDDDESDDEWHCAVEVEEEPEGDADHELRIIVDSSHDAEPLVQIEVSPTAIDSKKKEVDAAATVDAPTASAETSDKVETVGPEPPSTIENSVKELELQMRSTVAALRSVLIPIVPLEQIVGLASKSLGSKPIAELTLEPLLVPVVKPLVREVATKQWTIPQPDVGPTLPPASLKAPALKRRISVSLAGSKPAPRLVVKPRPSTLTPPQSVQRMLEQAETMLRELNSLIAAGNELLYPADAERDFTPRKSVRFCDEVDLIESVLEDSDMIGDELESLFYGSDEIECMSAEYFASVSIDAC